MTISSETRRAGPFIGNGSTTALPFTFKVFEAADLLVVTVDTATDVETTLILNSDYTVTLNGNQDANPGGTVNLASPLAVGTNAVVTSSMKHLQSTLITNQGGFYPRVINDSLDRVTILTQQLREALDRSVRIAVSSGLPGPTLPNPIANKIVGWNAAGDDLALFDWESPAWFSGQRAAAENAAIQAGNYAANASNFAANASNFADSADASAQSAANIRNLVGSLVAAAAPTVVRFSGDGATTDFTLPVSPGAEANTQVYVGGTYQQKDTYTVTGSTLSFAVAPTNGTDNIEVVIGPSVQLVIASALAMMFTQSGVGAVARTAQDKMRDVISARDFGAAGDDVTDDTDALQAALTAAAGAQLHIPAGVYRISDTLTIPADTLVYGAGSGTVIKPLDNSGDAASPIFSIRNVNGVWMRDLVIDGNATNLTAASGHCGVWLSGASDCVFERLTLRDIGKTALDSAGVHFNVTVYEPGDSTLAPEFDIENVPVERCVWRDCVFDDPDGKASFGLRLLSNFDNPIADDDFTVFVRECVIENCLFRGFAWNSLEISGPGVRHNTVQGCIFTGHRGYGPLDIDKGARHIEANDCIVRDTKAKQGSPANVVTVARIQGYDNGAGMIRYARHCVVRNLHVDGLGAAGSNSSVFLFSEAEDCAVEGGWWNASIDSGNSFGGAFGHRVSRCVYRGITVVGLTGGGDAFGNRRYTDVSLSQAGNAVIECRCECSYNGVWLENGSVGSEVLSGFIVRNNHFAGVTNVAVKLTKMVDAECSDNVIVSPAGPSYAINTDACSRARISRNTIRNPSTYGIQIEANCVETLVDGNVITEISSGGYLGIRDLAGLSNVVGNYCQRLQDGDIRGRKEAWGKFAPSSGSWRRGDICWNTEPSAGGNIGWVCTATGSGMPGTWKAFGAIDA